MKLVIVDYKVILKVWGEKMLFGLYERLWDIKYPEDGVKCYFIKLQ
jgi:hypothetical protein